MTVLSRSGLEGSSLLDGVEKFNSDRLRGRLGPLAGAERTPRAAGEQFLLALVSVSDFKAMRFRGLGHLFHICFIFSPGVSSVNSHHGG